MAKELILDTRELSQMFFENAHLWGVICPMPSYDLCHAINVSLRLNLVRRVDLDLRYYFEPQQSLTSLFSEEELDAEPTYFPVYRQYTDSNEPDIILYTNRHNGNVLIQPQKSIDYFLLIKNSFYQNHLQNINLFLGKIRQVNSCIRINHHTADWAKHLIL